MKKLLMVFSIGLLTAYGCGRSGGEVECIEVDEQLGDPGSRQWCDGEYSPTNLQWEGQMTSTTVPVCLSPEEDGQCTVCPTDEVRRGVEEQLHKDLAQYRPECTLAHWELGCMRTIEHAKEIGRDPDYCCFQVALWGDQCEG
ncbi:hypothetical protein [Enhygromyxa salina]|uniref:hypothetical protein n=1 Tax=Enhygromyxa salina TaxID=215803 RepID=UPI0011B2331C|nr:hypothetical protein [Enhygromyxa salina]